MADTNSLQEFEESLSVCDVLWDALTADEVTWRRIPRTYRTHHFVAKARKAAAMAQKLPKALRQNRQLRAQVKHLRQWSRHLEKQIQADCREEDKLLRVIAQHRRDLSNWRRKAARIASHLQSTNGEALVEAAARVAKIAFPRQIGCRPREAPNPAPGLPQSDPSRPPGPLEPKKTIDAPASQTDA